MLFGTESVQMNSILIGSFIIILTGIADDIKSIRARSKLIGTNNRCSYLRSFMEDFY